MDELIAVTDVRHVRDFPEHLNGRVFEPLADPRFFAQVRVDPELQTLARPNGADLAPKFLYELWRSRAAA